MPILGGYGNASEYAYRGLISDNPNPFDWVDLYNVNPGQDYFSGYAKITGITSKIPLRVSSGSFYSLISNVFDNGQTVTFDSDNINQASFDEYSNPNSRFKPGLGFNVINDFVENNQSINLKIYIPNVYESDFSGVYTTDVNVGRTVQDWIVQTKGIDNTPDSFNFLDIQTTTSTLVESNEITISGLESGYSFDADITSSSGNLIVNDVNREKSFSVSNNDKIKLSFTTPEDFNFLTDITLKLGTYSETWRVTTEIENLNVIFTPEDFTNESNLQLNTDYNSNQMTISELNLNSNLPVVLSNSNVSYEVERNGSIVKRFVDSPIGIVNNDKIRLRLKSSNLYNTSVSTTMKIGNTSTDWILTTRSAPPINITFTVTRSSPFDNQIVFELQSGTGTSILTFGSDNRVFTETLYQGSTYILQSTTGSLRITSGILELEDGIDNDWDDLRVSASSGSFSSVDGIFYYSI